MSEVEKLYNNANIKICKRKQGFTLKDCTDRDCKECGYYDIPPFTAEKQLELFKMFCKRYLEVSQHIEENGDLCFGIKATVGDYAIAFNKDFAECLACFANDLWQDLTESEKAEIKRILEG